MAQIGVNAEMLAVSDLDDKTVRMAKLEPCGNIQEAFDMALTRIKNEGKEPYAIIMPQASLTVPLQEE